MKSAACSTDVEGRERKWKGLGGSDTNGIRTPSCSQRRITGPAPKCPHVNNRARTRRCSGTNTEAVPSGGRGGGGSSRGRLVVARWCIGALLLLLLLWLLLIVRGWRRTALTTCPTHRLFGRRLASKSLKFFQSLCSRRRQTRTEWVYGGSRNKSCSLRAFFPRRLPNSRDVESQWQKEFAEHKAPLLTLPADLAPDPK